MAVSRLLYARIMGCTIASIMTVDTRAVHERTRVRCMQRYRGTASIPMHAHWNRVRVRATWRCMQRTRVRLGISLRHRLGVRRCEHSPVEGDDSAVSLTLHRTHVREATVWIQALERPVTAIGCLAYRRYRYRCGGLNSGDRDELRGCRYTETALQSSAITSADVPLCAQRRVRARPESRQATVIARA